MTAAALRLEAPADPVLLVARRLRDFLQAGEVIDARLLRDLLGSTTGRSAADGGWSMRQAYDALELAQVLWLGSAGAGMDLSSPSVALDALIDLGRRLSASNALGFFLATTILLSVEAPSDPLFAYRFIVSTMGQRMLEAAGVLVPSLEKN